MHVDVRAFLCSAFWALCDGEFGDILGEAGALIIAFWLIIIEGSCLLLADALRLPPVNNSLLDCVKACSSVRFLRGLLASVGVRRDERWV